MTALIECVPNFSEGRDPEVIEALAQAVSAVPGVQLLDISSGHAVHRTVLTFVGTMAAVSEAAWRAIAQAAVSIDLRRHRGVHPRQGATDVCPFVPLRESCLADCIRVAHAVGQRVGEELGIPVYLYGAAARREERRALADLRRGEYEGLAEKLSDPAWRPDFGPAQLNPRAGATVIGARELMIAFNVNLDTRDVAVARRIAAHVRSKGQVQRDAQGQVLRDAHGTAVRQPGLPHCAAAGWVIPEYGCAQVTMNLMDYRVTGLHTVFARIAELAQELGTAVVGSEVIGLVPEAALLAAGRHFAGLSTTVADGHEQLIYLAIERMGLKRMGLNSVAPFDPAEKILDYRLRMLYDGPGGEGQP